MIPRRVLIAAGLAAALLCPATAFAAPGDLDSAFGEGGVAVVEGDGDASARDVVVARNGTIITVGFDTQAQDPQTDTTLFGVRSSGDPDHLFGFRGVASFDEGDFDYGKAAVVQSTGDVVVVGTDNSRRIWLARVNPDGSLDAAFGARGIERLPYRLDGPTDHFGIALARGDRILVSLVTDRQRVVVTRRLANGGADRSFADDGASVLTSDALAGGLSYNVATAVLDDGRVVVGVGKPDRYVLLRVAPDGEPDRSFGRDGAAVGGLGRPFTLLSDLAVRPNGATIVVGSRSHETKSRPGYVTHPVAAKFTPDGRPDRSFGRRGHVELREAGARSEFTSLVLHGGGRLVAVGSTEVADFTTAFATDFLIARYRADGRLDRSFSSNGWEATNVATIDRASGVALERDGGIVVAGTLSDHGGPDRIGLVNYLGR